MSSILSSITDVVEFISAELIIVAIAAIFSYFVLSSLIAVRKSAANQRSVQKIADLQSSGIIDLSKLTSYQRSWATKHLVTKKAQSNLMELEMRGDAIASKHPISMMVPTLDLNKYKPIPAILTSLGITGTFVGITVGLSVSG